MADTGTRTSFKPVLWTGLVVLLVALAAGPVGLSATHVHWPAWLIAAIAAGAGVLAGVVKQLVDAYLKVRTDRIGSDAARRDRSADAVAKVSESRGGLPLVSEVTGRAALGIHPALPLPVGANPDLSVELPTYVPRDRDVDVRAAISRMTTTGGFVLLIGEPAAGKTRCAAEAIRTLPAGWRIYIRAGGTFLQQLLDDAVPMTRTVVWLDDVHELLDADTDATDHLTAATIRQLLLPGARPVIIIGTTWRDRYDRYTTPPVTETQDLLVDARAVIKMAEPIHLQAPFSEEEWQRAIRMADVDPRLAEAIGGGHHRTVTATLANRDALIRQWSDSDDPYTAAVISATIDARRCGYPEPVPTHVITALAPHYLTTRQRPAARDGWLTTALTAACRPVRGDTRPMHEIGNQPGHVDGYHVSDILLQHAKTTLQPPDEQIWHVLIDTTHDDAVHVAIGTTAYLAGLHELASAAFTPAAAAGNADAQFAIAVLLEQRGDGEQAEVFYRRAVDAGNIEALNNLANLLKQRGMRRDRLQSGVSICSRSRKTAAAHRQRVCGVRSPCDTPR